MNIGQQLHKNFSHFIDDSINKLVFRATGAILFVLFLAVFFFWNRLPPQLPLYYSLPWGQEQIGTPLELVVVLVSAGLLFLINTALAVVLRSDQIFFSRLLFFGGTGIVILILITGIKIMLLVT